MFCVNCGKAIIETANFCRHCGAAIQHTVEQPSNVNNQVPEPPTADQSKDMVAREFLVALKILGVSILIALISIPIIYSINSDNTSGLVYGMNPDELISSNQYDAARENVPKVFLYAFLVILFGRYLIKAFSWADARVSANEENSSTPS